MLRRALPDALRLSGRLRAAPGSVEPLEAVCRGFATDAAGGEVGAISGVPDEVYARKVVIYSPARTAGQQGMSKVLGASGRTLPWKIDFDMREKWQNPLIGWTSTADPVENVARAALSFESKEAAARFCEKHGWAYEVQEPRPRRTIRQKRFLSYGDNFSVKRKGVPMGGLISESMKEGLAGDDAYFQAQAKAEGEPAPKESLSSKPRTSEK